MKKKLLLSLGLGAALASTGYAEGLFENSYLRIALGSSLVQDQDFDTGEGAAGVVDTELDAGIAVKAAAGIALEAIRLEFEVSLRDNGVNVHNVGGVTPPGSTGDNTSIGYMFNAFYDFHNLFNQDVFIPYVGAGIGLLTVEFDGYTIEGVPEVLDDDDASLAFQIIVGGEVDVVEDQVSLFTEYTFVSATDLNVDTTLGGNNSDIDYDVHSVFVGTRFKF